MNPDGEGLLRLHERLLSLCLISFRCSDLLGIVEEEALNNRAGAKVNEQSDLQNCRAQVIQYLRFVSGV